jgi:hypothetical protein
MITITQAAMNGVPASVIQQTAPGELPVGGSSETLTIQFPLSAVTGKKGSWFTISGNAGRTPFSFEYKTSPF